MKRAGRQELAFGDSESAAPGRRPGRCIATPLVSPEVYEFQLGGFGPFRVVRATWQPPHPCVGACPLVRMLQNWCFPRASKLLR